MHGCGESSITSRSTIRNAPALSSGFTKARCWREVSLGLPSPARWVRRTDTRGLPLDDGSNNFTARATDRAGNYKDYPTSSNHTVIIDKTPSVTYAYDANGNMTSKTVNGSFTTTYEYTPEESVVTDLVSGREEGEVHLRRFSRLSRPTS